MLDEILSVDPTVSEAFFHFIHHYIDDADIRRKDPGYRQADSTFLRYIEAYERGLERP